MLFDSLTDEEFKLLIGSLLICSLFCGWAMDAILGRFSFGVLPTAALIAGLGYVGLRGMDWAVLHHHVPPAFTSPTGYVSAAAICVTLGFLTLCLMKRVVTR